MKSRGAKRAVCSIAVVAFLLATAYLAFRHLDGPRVVAQATAPDGTEFVVMQRCNWGFEPFTTSCYYRKPGGPWGWFYYDHQDWYWYSGRTEIDEEKSVINVYRGNRKTCMFNWKREAFTLMRYGGRTLIGAQTWLPQGKTPWDR